MTWDEYYVRYLDSLEAKQIVYYPASVLDVFNFFSGLITPSEMKDMIEAFHNVSDEDIYWFAKALEDEKGKWFAAGVIVIATSVSEKPLPEILFAPMIRAAVYEINPSLNRFFVECASNLGKRRVNEALLDYVEFGTDFEKAGAANALYWSHIGLRFQGFPPEYTKEYATPESQAEYEEFADIRIRKQALFLKEFVASTNVSVQQSIIPDLNLDPSAYPEDLKPLVNKAIEIAKTHSDEYIRHRVEVQLGTENLLKPLPYRKKPLSNG